MKNQKKNLGGGFKGGCERRIKVFVKIQEINFGEGGSGGGSGKRGGGGKGGCKRRIKVFVKIQEINFGEGGSGGGGSGKGGSGWWGGRVDVNEELKFL